MGRDSGKSSGRSGNGGAVRPLGGYQIKPLYPEFARQRGIEGTVLLKVRVTAQGRVETVQVERSAGHPSLDHSATEAVQRWRFEPARQNGVPVAVWVLIPVDFRLEH
jgi:protein TonB